jgi:pimeloyl-ACP methyl ester carboxylesterase
VTIVFLHGFLGSQLDLQPIAKPLQSSMGTLCLDLPGHGQAIGLPAETYSFLEPLTSYWSKSNTSQNLHFTVTPWVDELPCIWA